MTQIIVEALEQTGQRGIINKGWGGLGECKFLVSIHVCLAFCLSTSFQYDLKLIRILFSVAEPNDNIFLLDNCPHDWLFLQCKAVVSV